MKKVALVVLCMAACLNGAEKPKTEPANVTTQKLTLPNPTTLASLAALIEQYGQRKPTSTAISLSAELIDQASLNARIKDSDCLKDIFGPFVDAPEHVLSLTIKGGSVITEIKPDFLASLISSLTDPIRKKANIPPGTGFTMTCKDLNTLAQSCSKNKFFMHVYPHEIHKLSPVAHYFAIRGTNTFYAYRKAKPDTMLQPIENGTIIRDLVTGKQIRAEGDKRTTSATTSAKPAATTAAATLPTINEPS